MTNWAHFPNQDHFRSRAGFTVLRALGLNRVESPLPGQGGSSLSEQGGASWRNVFFLSEQSVRVNRVAVPGVHGTHCLSRAELRGAPGSLSESGGA